MDGSAPRKLDASEVHVPWETLDTGEERIEPPSDPEESGGIAEPGPAEQARDSGPDVEFTPTRGGGWTLPLLCAGVALISCCALIPQADANRRLAYEREELQRDLQTVEKQIAVNEEFLRKVGQDPTLAERLAQRQMKVIPEGSRVLELPRDAGGGTSMSPFQLVNVPPPAPLPPYKPIGGVIARLCYDVHSRLYVIGVALGMIAVGLVLGSAPAPR